MDHGNAIYAMLQQGRVMNTSSVRFDGRDGRDGRGEVTLMFVSTVAVGIMGMEKKRGRKSGRNRALSTLHRYRT